ncbi:MAG: alpha/beta hydrolase [Candidatus Omnitrophica bacterium]|nr:alpha/beta hydrolase [Candidatus Omnitrophota bacterium]
MTAKVSVKKDILKINRFLIPYRIYENAGPHIVCINGIQQSMGMWHTFITRFSRDYRIVLFDFPNQGKGKFLSGPKEASLDEQVEILHTVIDKTGVNKDAMLCSASWGGVVAVVFASEYRDRIKRLTLASLGTKPNRKMIETIKNGAGIDIKDRTQIAQTLIKSFGGNLPEQIKRKIINQFCKMTDEELRAFYTHGLFVISSKKLSDLVNLKNIKAKTVLLIGEKDEIIDLEDVKFLATQIPDCKVRIVKNVGHFLHMEREDVLDIYEDILVSK